jgi:hypothetical protein
MHWFRYYHGLCTDPKLHRVARAAQVRRHVVIAAWCADEWFAEISFG